MINDNLFGTRQLPQPSPFLKKAPPKRPSTRERDESLLRLGITGTIDRYLPLALSSTVPIVPSYDVDIDFVRSQDCLIDFNKINSANSYDRIVSFYLNDYQFIRIMNNPDKYIEKLKAFRYVITPDFSQYINMPDFQRYAQNCWNKVLAVYMQQRGVHIIFNVSWSLPDSYQYAFAGLPSDCVIAINCAGIKSSALSMYLWRQGYEEALRTLKPRLIVRYGDKMPCEREEVSVYFRNTNLVRVRNGR